MSLNHHADAGSILDRAIAATRRMSATTTVPPAAIARAKRLAVDGPSGLFVEPAVARMKPRFLGDWSRRRALLQTAATVALLVGAGAFATLGGLTRPNSMFAAAIEQMRKVTVVRFAVQVSSRGEAGGNLQGVQIETDTGVTRLEHKGTVTLIERPSGKILTLLPAERKAFLHETGAAADQPEGGCFFKCVENIVPKDGEAKGRERLEGVDTEVFAVVHRNSTQTFWIDPQTRLPVQMTHGFGTGRNAMTIMMNRFEWNPDIDPATLSFAIPEGYASSILKVAAQGDGKHVGDGVNAPHDKMSAAIADFLRLCAEADEGRFPDDLSRTTVQGIANRLSTDPRFTDRTDRIGAAIGGLFGVQRGLGLAGGEVHYLGKGRRANDASGIIAWYTLGDNTIAIGDDFSVRTIETKDVPALQK